jgi:hypothetical protein
LRLQKVNQDILEFQNAGNISNHQNPIVMKICFFTLYLISAIAQNVHAQKNSNSSALFSLDRTVLLEEKSDTTANVGFGDFDGDGHLDILLVKGL